MWQDCPKCHKLVAPEASNSLRGLGSVCVCHSQPSTINHQPSTINPAESLEDMLAAQLNNAGIPFVRQFKFCKTRRWRSDFKIENILVEVDGLIWGQGGYHQMKTAVENNMEKANQATLQGFRHLRFSGKHVRAGEALRVIEACLQKEDNP